MKKSILLISFTLTILCSSLAQQFSLRGSISRPYWGFAKLSNYNENVGEMITKGNKIFDFSIGGEINIINGKNIFTSQVNYESNNVRATLKNWYGDGELSRVFALHFLSAQIRYARKLKIKNKELILGGGLDLDLHILKKLTLEKTYLIYTGSTKYGPAYIPDEEFNIVFRQPPFKKNLIPGIHLDVKYEIGKIKNRNVYAICNTSMTLSSSMLYQWRFLGDFLAGYLAYRFSPRIGIEFPIN